MIKKTAQLLCWIFFATGLTALGSALKTKQIWSDVYFEQIILNIGHGVDEAGSHILKSYIYGAFLPAGLIFILFFYFCRRYLYIFSLALICWLSASYFVKLPDYLENRLTDTHIFATDYQDPAQLSFSFPEQKRNLIVLYLESLETTYHDPQLVGEDLLPNLTRLSRESLSFSGFHQLQTADYTIAAMIAGHCAIPYKYTTLSNYTSLHNFLPSAVCSPQILKQAGYHTEFMKGSTLRFARTGIFFNTHGIDQTWGEEELEDSYLIDPEKNAGTSWGLRDQTFYDLAKQRLTTLASEEQPFALTMLTLDTHGPDIFLDPSCPKKFNDARDIMICADQMASQFIEWIQSQDFYKNTVLIVLSDHPQSGTNDLFPKAKDRKILNLFFNIVPDPKTVQTDRKWTTLDLAPTILDALGISSENGAFGLGRSLFSNQPTLFEQKGTELDRELLKNAPEYARFNALGDLGTPQFKNYPDTTDPIENIEDYALFADRMAKMVWLDTLSMTLPKQPTEDLTLELEYLVTFANSSIKHLSFSANGKIIGQRTIQPADPQPIHEKLTIPADLIGSDRHLLIKFNSDDIGYTLTAVGIGLKNFSIRY